MRDEPVGGPVDKFTAPRQPVMREDCIWILPRMAQEEGEEGRRPAKRTVDSGHFRVSEKLDDGFVRDAKRQVDKPRLPAAPFNDCSGRSRRIRSQVDPKSLHAVTLVSAEP